MFSLLILIILVQKYIKTNLLFFATHQLISLLYHLFINYHFNILFFLNSPAKIFHLLFSSIAVFIYFIPFVSRSVDVLSHLGGKGLSPYYCLIEGGKNGWLIKEMQDLFYYSQILHQGENITSTRIISDKVNINELPNLMRSIGYYPSNEEVIIFLFFISNLRSIVENFFDYYSFNI